MAQCPSFPALQGAGIALWDAVPQCCRHLGRQYLQHQRQYPPNRWATSILRQPAAIRRNMAMEQCCDEHNPSRTKIPADAPLIIENGVADNITLDGCENVIIRNMVGDQGAGDVRMLTNRPVQISNSKGISFTRQ